MPIPPAAFSPFTTTQSGRCCSRSPGRRSASARRPGLPTTSPTNRSFTARHSPTPLPLPAMALLEARALVKRYGARVAVSDVSLEAGPGELVGIIGPNGAGKTTLLSMLAGIQRPDAGELRAPDRIGWVPQ